MCACLIQADLFVIIHFYHIGNIYMFNTFFLFDLMETTCLRISYFYSNCYIILCKAHSPQNICICKGKNYTWVEQIMSQSDISVSTANNNYASSQ